MFVKAFTGTNICIYINQCKNIIHYKYFVLCMSIPCEILVTLSSAKFACVSNDVVHVCNSWLLSSSRNNFSTNWCPWDIMSIPTDVAEFYMKSQDNYRLDITVIVTWDNLICKGRFNISFHMHISRPDSGLILSLPMNA
jgi:hypothetical protein